MTGMPWVNRRDDTWVYKATLIGWFVIAYAILMTIPFAYDQLNRKLYEAAKQNDELVIQEFSSTMEDAIVASCVSANSGSLCPPDQLYQALAGKRLIALDYVFQMENKIQTKTGEFAIAAFFQLVSLSVGLLLIVRTSNNHSWRFIGFIAIFMVILVGFHFLSDLPHKNTKYYYVFGALFAILLSTSDFFHRLDVSNGFDRLEGNAKLALAQIKYSKWTSIFQFALALLAAVMGTISFTLLGYIRTIFGESFVLYPLIGILVSMAYLAFLFYFGIVRNILLVLGELEEAMAT